MPNASELNKQIQELDKKMETIKDIWNEYIEKRKNLCYEYQKQCSMEYKVDIELSRKGYPV